MQYQEAAESYNRQMNTASMRENLKASGQARLFDAQKMAWAKDDREKANKVATAYSKGLLKGLGGK